MIKVNTDTEVVVELNLQLHKMNNLPEKYKPYKPQIGLL